MNTSPNCCNYSFGLLKYINTLFFASMCALKFSFCLRFIFHKFMQICLVARLPCCYWSVGSVAALLLVSWLGCRAAIGQLARLPHCYWSVGSVAALLLVSWLGCVPLSVCLLAVGVSSLTHRLQSCACRSLSRGPPPPPTVLWPTQ